MEKEIKLKVGELTGREDFGRGIARLDTKLMNKLDVKEGDILEIEGKNKTGAVAIRSYPADIGMNVLRIDGLVRKNCDASIGESVTVRKSDVKEAKKLVLAPAQKGFMLHISPNLIRQNLYMRPMTKRDIIITNPVFKTSRNHDDIFSIFGIDIEEVFMPMGTEMRLVVVDTKPDGITKVTDMTEVEILPEAVEVAEAKLPTVTYEDIGGLSQIVPKIREMIEIPLRHPEIFERLGVEPPKGILLFGPPGTGKTLIAKAVANESGAHFISVAGPEFMCVSKDTSIFLNPKGIVEIGSLLNVKGESRNVGNFNAIYPEEEIKVFSINKDLEFEPKPIEYIVEVPTDFVYKVKLENGSTLEVSPNQPFLVIDEDGNTVWKKITEINENDYVAFTTKLPLNNKSQNLYCENILDEDFTYILQDEKWIKLKDFKGNIEGLPVAYSSTKSNTTKMKPIRLPSMTSEDLLEFLGYMYSEGSINDEEVSIANMNEKIVERAKELFEKLFEFDKTRIKYNNSNKNSGKVVVYSKILAEYLKKVFGLPEGRKPKDLQFSPIIFKCSESEICAFLKGYFHGDGTTSFSRSGYPTFRYFSKSKTLLFGIKTLLLMLGIRSSTVKPWKTRFSNIFMLEVKDGEGRKLFYERIKPEFNERTKKYFLRKNKYRDSTSIPVNGIFKKIKEIEGLRYDVDIKENSIEPYISGRFRMTRKKASEIFDLLKQKIKTSEGKELLDKIERILKSNLGWIRIDSVKKIEKKTTLIDIAIKDNSNFLEIDNMLLLHNSKFYGESEENLRRIFEEADKNAPSIIFIDEIDAIAPKREQVVGEVERRVVSTLLTQMDGLKSRGKVVVIAATNLQNMIDPALRRVGRFDREIEIPVPDKQGRKEILQIHTRQMPLEKDVDLDHLSDITYGYVGADISGLAKEAAMHALRRVIPEISSLKEGEPIPKEILEKLKVTKDDFDYALRMVQPSGMREVLIEIPKVKWEDVGGLEEVKEALKESVELPLKNPECFKRIGIKPPRGILLYGPPGVGKTYIVKALANETGVNLIAIKGPEVLSMYVGESERHVREVFRRAKQVSPSIILFDEIDSLAPRRGMEVGTRVTEQVVSQLLTEMSGISEMEGVTVIATSNRPDLLDPALLRPGRFDKLIYVPAPDEKTRLEIFKVHTKSMPIKSVDLKKLAKETEGYSGADIEALCREAALFALREDVKAKTVESKHFEKALKKVKPSITEDVFKRYQKAVEDLRKTKVEEEEKANRYIG